MYVFRKITIPFKIIPNPNIFTYSSKGQETGYILYSLSSQFLYLEDFNHFTDKIVLNLGKNIVFFSPQML